MEMNIKMKRAISVVFTVATLCSLFSLAVIAPVNGAAAGYTHTTYFLANAVTLDGKWTTSSEWADTDIRGFGAGQTAIFRSKWGATSDFSVISQYILVEILNDDTNDTGDYWQFCFDGDMSGGTAPQAGDIRIDIAEHKTITAYNGNGAGWTQISAPASFQWSNSISASPASSTPHWICEIIIDKIVFGIGAQYWLRIAVNDASNATAGVRSWPPTSRDVPNDWGDIPYDMNPVPESLGFGVVVLLSSVAVLVGFFGLRKRPRTYKWPQ